MSAHHRVIVPLDVSTRADALALARPLAPAAAMFKVGLELFTACGPGIVREIAALGCGVMLDLKLHDIPNTVQRAAANAAALGVQLLTVHASGGRAMLHAACAGARSGAADAHVPAPKILAVTVLTSIDQTMLRDDLGVDRTLPAQVDCLALHARDAGCDGVVASPHETAALRAACGPAFLIVTPGVRPHGTAAADQRRVMTPAQALAAGADLLVIGRPITASDNPRAALDAINSELTSPATHS